MKIVSEPASILAYPEKGELTILIEGFRLTLNGDEAQLLQNALAKGLSLLFPTRQGPPGIAGDVAESAGAAEIRALVEAAKQKLERYDAGSEPRRPLSA